MNGWLPSDRCSCYPVGAAAIRFHIARIAPIRFQIAGAAASVRSSGFRPEQQLPAGAAALGRCSGLRPVQKVTRG